MTTNVTIDLKSVFPADRILFPLQQSSKDQVVQELAEGLVATGQIAQKDMDKFVKEILAREALGTTAIGKGIAIPHIRTDLSSSLIALLGFSKEGIDFNSLDKKPTHAVFMLASPMAQKDQQIRILGRIAAVANHENFLKFLLQCESAQAVADLLEEIEGQVPAP
ncbi:MAG: PTS transporter subunit EIIA [Actinobacteria bacterium]|nr:PTS transporter subunit EIIA [Actinomycetota bacterium]